MGYHYDWCIIARRMTARVEEMARRLAVVDAAAPTAGPEAIDGAARDEQDRWTWAGKEP